MGKEAADPPAVALLLGVVRGLRRGGWGVDATRATAWYGARVARVVAQALGTIAGGRCAPRLRLGAGTADAAAPPGPSADR